VLVANVDLLRVKAIDADWRGKVSSPVISHGCALPTSISRPTGRWQFADGGV